MLFDLRSRGRRNVVKIVYSFLAVLMGAGLVLFGIGGAVGGGFLNGITGSSSGSGSSPAKTQKHLEAIVRKDPKNAQAWARLVTVRLNIAAAASGNQDANGGFTAQGKAALAGVDSAWTHYAALTPAKPDLDLAAKMEQVYGPQALNQPANVVKTIEYEIAATKKPTISTYERYAVFASLANQTRKSKLAQSQAQSLAAAGKKGAARTKATAAVKDAITQGEATLKAQTQPAGAATTGAAPTTTG